LCRRCVPAAIDDLEERELFFLLGEPLRLPEEAARAVAGRVRKAAVGPQLDAKLAEVIQTGAHVAVGRSTDHGSLPHLEDGAQVVAREDVELDGHAPRIRRRRARPKIQTARMCVSM